MQKYLKSDFGVRKYDQRMKLKFSNQNKGGIFMKGEDVSKFHENEENKLRAMRNYLSRARGLMNC